MCSPRSQRSIASQLKLGPMPSGENQWTPFVHVPSYMRLRTDLVVTFKRAASSATVKYSSGLSLASLPSTTLPPPFQSGEAPLSRTRLNPGWGRQYP